MTIPRVALSPGYDISRIVKGGWHLAGDHGPIDREQSCRDMAAFVQAGITTFDCADIYAGVEELIGAFRRTAPDCARAVQLHTKFVPDLADLARVDRRYVETGIDRSLKRLGIARLDLVQFHWWDFAVPGYVEAAFELDRLRRAGKIRLLGITNFDVAHLAELVAAGIPIAAHQVQYSLIDRRPERGMIAFCREHAIALLCYGTVAGGFLSERWLKCVEPKGPLSNRSLVKYKLIIDDWGGWSMFQDLLRSLKQIADKHASDIATIATRMILDRSQVAAAIVGATSRAHLARHAAIGAITLDDADRRLVFSEEWPQRGPEGDVYVLERDRNGPHGRIMKYELNATT